MILHTPGHTPGSSCLTIEGRIAFAGDLVSSLDKPHVQVSFADDWAQMPARLQALQPELTYTGHGPRPLIGAELQLLAQEDIFS